MNPNIIEVKPTQTASEKDISFFTGGFDCPISHSRISLGMLHEFIISDYLTQTRMLRRMGNISELCDRERGVVNRQNYQKFKESFDFIVPGGVVNDYPYGKVSHRSGLVVLTLKIHNTAQLKEHLKNDCLIGPSIAHSFTSPCGEKMNVLFRVGTDIPHSHSFNALSNYLALRYPMRSISSHEPGTLLASQNQNSLIRRNCSIGYDPDAYYNKNAKPLPIEECRLRTEEWKFRLKAAGLKQRNKPNF